MIRLPTRRARWGGSEGLYVLRARREAGRSGVHRRSFSFACRPTRRPQPQFARKTPAGTADPLRSFRARGVWLYLRSPGDPLTEHPAETAAAKPASGRAPVDVEELHKLVLQSLDDNQAVEVVS